jgi:hypothetical protein
MYSSSELRSMTERVAHSARCVRIWGDRLLICKVGESRMVPREVPAMVSPFGILLLALVSPLFTEQRSYPGDALAVLSEVSQKYVNAKAYHIAGKRNC